MKVEYNNLYTHFIFTTFLREALIFSVSKNDVDHVCKYILNQPEHHKKHSFKDEYDSFIKIYQKTINPK
jgi:hypothetical protein